MELPALPLISSPQLRKHAFTHVSVFRLSPTASAHDLEQIENVDNDRLSFLGRAAIDYALATCASDVPDLEAGLASCARTYDIVKWLHRGWRDPLDPENPSEPASLAPSAPSDAQAAQLMEAYVGALVLESEHDGVRFAQGVVRALSGHPAEEAPARVTPTEEPPAPPNIRAATGQLHDLATHTGILLTWDDRVSGPKHAEEWTSDVSLRHRTSGRTWPCVARGVGKSKKLARADAAVKALAQWDGIVR